MTIFFCTTAHWAGFSRCYLGRHFDQTQTECIGLRAEADLPGCAILSSIVGTA